MTADPHCDTATGDRDDGLKGIIVKRAPQEVIEISLMQVTLRLVALDERLDAMEREAEIERGRQKQRHRFVMESLDRIGGVLLRDIKPLLAELVGREGE